MSRLTQMLNAKILMVLILLLTTLAAVWMLRPQDADQHNDVTAIAVQEDEHGTENSGSADGKTEPPHTEEGEIHLSAMQFKTAQLQLSTVTHQAIGQTKQLSGTLQLDTDQQAHVASLFAGQVEQVNVSTGQAVQRGQVLATVLIPELVEFSANLTTA